MKLSQIFNDLDHQCIDIDWKTEIDDMVYQLAYHWKVWKKVFEHEDIRSLVENYQSEVPMDYLPALGQELSVHNLLLYQLHTDSDSYRLLIIEMTDKESFENEAKNRKVKVWLLKQSRKKLSSKATRLNLANRLPYEAVQVDDRDMVFYSFPFALQLRLADKGNAILNAKCSILDFRVFPPVSSRTAQLGVISYNEQLKLWAATFYDSKDKTSVRVGKDILDLSDWREVASSELGINSLSSLNWVNESLLILYEDYAWFVDSATANRPVCEKIFSRERDRTNSFAARPRFIRTLNGETYVHMSFQVYHLKKNKLIPLFKLNEKDLPECIATGNNRFTYLNKGRQVEVDIKERKIRSRPVPGQDNSSSIHQLTTKWAVVTRFGYTNREIDILQFWHIETDTWQRLKLGAFGQYGITDVGITKDNDVILAGHEMIFKVQDFFTKLKSFEEMKVEDWTEKWPDENDGSESTGIVDRIKALFRN
ncbi:MAG: hypothetical protein K9J17_17800 [Flavobacteriales bacterium]|nr:hypothetical protein [Flavobacteriales bacterium]